MSSLFDTPDVWQHDPMEAFKAFVKTDAFLLLARRKPVLDEKGNPLYSMRDSSANVYISMFGRFIRWLGERELELQDVTSDVIRSFLDEPGDGKDIKLNSSIRIGYIRLLERVFAHLDISPNPASRTAFIVHQTRAGGRDKPMSVLTIDQQVKFMQALPAVAPFNPDSMDDGTQWKRRRDRAILSLMLGAGLKVSELVGIETHRVGTVDTSGSIPVSITPKSVGGTSRQHETQLRPFAVPEVVAWVAERKARKIPGALLFPSSEKGQRLDKSTVYLLAKATYARAGIEIQRRGPRTLRNSFAVRELAQGGSLELVKEFLGHRKEKSTQKYNIGNKNRAKLDVSAILTKA